MKMILVLCFGCALVAVSQAQDMTSLMFQAMGIEMPPMPPQMPQSLREHLYPQQQLRRQQLFQLRQAAAARAAALQRAAQVQKAKANPYTSGYSTSNNAPEKTEVLVSQANAIRRPGDMNSLVNKGNPYSASRAITSSNPAVRNAALAARRPAVPTADMYRQYRQYRQWRDQPKKINEAQAAGCKLPIDSSAASILMFGDCRNPTARMVCQMEMMSCVNVGMSAMCCPYGMNKLAMDTISYVNKLQHFVSEVA